MTTTRSEVIAEASVPDLPGGYQQGGSGDRGRAIGADSDGGMKIAVYMERFQHAVGSRGGDE